MAETHGHHERQTAGGPADKDRRTRRRLLAGAAGALGVAAAEVVGNAAPAIRLHDLRHTHATLLLTAREPVHVVSQRLGHASAVVTMGVYAHVLPGSQREAADHFARLIEEAQA